LVWPGHGYSAIHYHHRNHSDGAQQWKSSANHLLLPISGEDSGVESFLLNFFWLNGGGTKKNRGSHVVVPTKAPLISSTDHGGAKRRSEFTGSLQPQLVGYRHLRIAR
jgi:hypothetical protein